MNTTYCYAVAMVFCVTILFGAEHRAPVERADYLRSALTTLNGDKTAGCITDDLAAIILSYEKNTWLEDALEGNYHIRDATPQEAEYEDESALAKIYDPENERGVIYMRKKGRIACIADLATACVYVAPYNKQEKNEPFLQLSYPIKWCWKPVTVCEQHKLLVSQGESPDKIKIHALHDMVRGKSKGQEVADLVVNSRTTPGSENLPKPAKYACADNRVACVYNGPHYGNIMVWDITTGTRIMRQSTSGIMLPELCFLGNDLLVVAEGFRGMTSIELWDTSLHSEQENEQEKKRQITVIQQPGNFNLNSFEPSSDTECVLMRGYYRDYRRLDKSYVNATKILQFGVKK